MSEESVEKPNYYTLAEQNPDKYSILKNGAVYGKDEGRIVAIDNSRNPHAISTETTQNMHKLKRLQAQSEILHGIAEGTGAIHWRGGVRNMAGAMAKLVMEGGNRAPEAFRVLLQGADLIDVGRGSGSNDLPAGGARIELGAEALEKLINAIQQAKKQRQDDDNGVIDV